MLGDRSVNRSRTRNFVDRFPGGVRLPTMSSLSARPHEKRLMTVKRTRFLFVVPLSVMIVACSGSDAADEPGGGSASPSVMPSAPSTTNASSNPEASANTANSVPADGSSNDEASVGDDDSGPSAPQGMDPNVSDSIDGDSTAESDLAMEGNTAEENAPADESAATDMQDPGADDQAAPGDDDSDSMPMSAEEDPTNSDDPAEPGNPADQSEQPPADEMTPGEEFTGTCTASEVTRMNASGTGPHDVIIETNSDPGIDEGTIFRPADLGGDEKYPILVWGQGACSQNGLANETAMVEIASHGYFVVADGTPNGSGGRMMDRSDMEAMGAPLIAYIDWAVAENDKPCSAYYQSLDTAMISSNGFSCGGLMAQGTVTDPRIVTWGVTSSGMAGATQSFYDAIDTPVLFVEGGPAEVAYDGGLEGYEAISALGVPVLWFSKDIGHGGDLFQPDGGDFTRINLAWLNWWLKGDESETGKGMLVGADCPYCDDPSWEVMSANVP